MTGKEKKRTASNNFGRKLKWADREELREAVEEYFEKRAEEKKPPSFTGLALHLGFVSKTSIHQYGERDQFADIIQWARLRVENYYEEALSTKRSGHAGAIFILKNHGWSDTMDMNHTGDLSISPIVWAKPKKESEVKSDFALN